MATRRGLLPVLAAVLCLWYLFGRPPARDAGYRADLGGDAEVDFAPPAPRTLFRHAALAASLLKSAGADGRVVVTLSTFGGRAEKVRGAVESLARQTRRPDRIYVNLARSVRRLASSGGSSDSDALPKALADLERELGKDYLVVLHPPDYGPSTKLLPALLVETNPRTAIVVADDDVVYHPRTVETLEFSRRGHPACFCCEEPQWIRYGLFPWVRSQRSPGTCRGYPCAYAGEAFLRSHFPDLGLFNYSGAPKGCRLHDDVWIGGYLYRKGIVPRLVDADFSSVVSHRPWDELTVHSVPNTEREYRNPCLAYFDYFR
ncbi:hypothetical protein DFJ74DRAFT_602389 [Hyaloraphidium curvatum]|nr:hypothetical protein DFJ74DRAFT_602389 [Hyaloraphidium curvatum]